MTCLVPDVEYVGRVGGKEGTRVRHGAIIIDRLSVLHWRIPNSRSRPLSHLMP